MSYASHLTDIRNSVTSAQGDIDTMWTYRGSATTEWMAGHDHEAIYWLIGCIGETIDTFYDLVYNWYPYSNGGVVYHFLERYTRKEYPEADPYVLTVEKICEEWAKDDFKGRALTIAYIDRMRQILWDEPFSAIWAARPEQ